MHPSHSNTAHSPRQCWKLVLAYDGTDFRGWQVQPGERTIQGELARVLRIVTGESVLPQGSGRTDAGVHAEGQVVSLELQAPIPPDRMLRALNRRLPPSIRVMEAKHAPKDFHARANVVSKLYEYRIFLSRELRSVSGEPGAGESRGKVERICSPAQARYLWDCRWPLHFDDMLDAAARVVGTHRFTSFAASDPDRARRMAADAAAPDGAVPTDVRTVFASTFVREENLLIYRVSGSGFLHHMVRNLVGTFVDVGAGRMKATDVSRILDARDRRAAGQMAPPQGLVLKCVHYRDEAAL